MQIYFAYRQSDTTRNRAFSSTHARFLGSVQYTRNSNGKSRDFAYFCIMYPATSHHHNI